MTRDLAAFGERGATGAELSSPVGSALAAEGVDEPPGPRRPGAPRAYRGARRRPPSSLTTALNFQRYIFPITFIFNDILTEVYGYERSRRIIWTGLGCQVLAILTYLIAGALPPAPFWPNQEAYSIILGFAPRVAAAGILSYFCGEFANSFVLSKMKYWEKGARGLKQGWRFVASTIVGEGVDSTVFMAVAFSGTMPPTDLTRTAVTLYGVKVVYEVVALPVSTRFADWVKSVEGIDHLDTPQSTNYNPFAVLADGVGARSCSNSTIGDR